MFKFATNTLSIPKIWTESFALYKQTFFKIWYLIFFAQLITALLTIPYGLAFIGKFPQLGEYFWRIYYYFLLVISKVIFMLITAAVFHRIYCLTENENYRLTESLKYVFLSKMRLILTAMIFFFLGFLLLGTSFSYLLNNDVLFATVSSFSKLLHFFIIFSSLFILTVYCLLFFPILFFVLFKNTGIISSIKQSIRLMYGNLWRTFLVFLVPVLGFIIINAAIVFGFKFFAIYINSTATLIFAQLLNLILFIILLPYIKSVLLVQFNDLLLRHKVI